MDEKQLVAQAEEVSFFVRTLQSLWRNEPWEDVEPYAERAWRQVTRLGKNWPWSTVRDFVRESWR